MTLRKKYLSVLLAVVFLALTGFATDRYFEITKYMSIFSRLYKEVNTYYVEEVNPNTLMEKSIEAMLLSLDPYTNYISADKIEDYRTLNTGQYGGIGASTVRIDDKIRHLWRAVDDVLDVIVQSLRDRKVASQAPAETAEAEKLCARRRRCS